MILLIDNYDSFTYNLVQLIGSIYPDLKVVRNDELSPKEIEALAPEKIIFSPGPGRPENAGSMMEIIDAFYDKVPMLGICLGHQALAGYFGASIIYAPCLFHGKPSEMKLDLTSPLFENLPEVITGARYHSLCADPASIPDCLKVIATTGDNQIMAIAHRKYPVYGLQFHPESIMTSHGMELLENFINL